MAGVLLIVGGITALGVTFVSQQHAPQPSAAAAGEVAPADQGPALQRSVPVSVSIPAIGVTSKLLDLGLNADGSIQVPSLVTSAAEAGWYKYSATPGQVGASVIEGHVDSYQGPAVFYRLGALRPGDSIEVTLADGITAIFRVTGVREYPKSNFPAKAIYGTTNYAALRLITCGGVFDYATGHYLSSTVVFASLTTSRSAGSGYGYPLWPRGGRRPFRAAMMFSVTPIRVMITPGGQVTETAEQISRLLHEASETHHQVFRIVDGADDDWASWYAQWLIDLSELPDLLRTRPVRSELIYLLVTLGKRYTAEAPGESWEPYYARQILSHFQPADG